MELMVKLSELMVKLSENVEGGAEVDGQGK
jgi:hypothetical protein